MHHLQVIEFKIQCIRYVSKMCNNYCMYIKYNSMVAYFNLCWLGHTLNTHTHTHVKCLCFKNSGTQPMEGKKSEGKEQDRKETAHWTITFFFFLT
jgi:hypothetical protein